MASVSSISSPRTVPSSIVNGKGSHDYVQYSAGFPSAANNGAYQPSLASARMANEASNLNPDELFTKHTVSEVRSVQQRLRAEADAKQEELRLMVGERYRDLLQASSSIISIALSSRRVSEALRECREEIASQQVLPIPPKTAAIEGIDDSHLLTLQVLSAHMKLLLDAPEHLWRLIERKKYFHAAWLFLLARVVHQALVQMDENDEQSWASEGVDVLTEFPLVQRQWEVVSQFRTQIIHKSTLSLREASLSSEDTCAVLVTLHLLDSRPLSETLVALFSQRSKSLQSLLSWNPEVNANDTAHILPLREVTQAMKSSFNTISQTICVARSIFMTSDSHPSLASRVLMTVSEDDGSMDDVPESLNLSTQSLLTQLTSSANFQLLPPTLKYYKPYVDLTSSSASVSQLHLTQMLQDWFQSSFKQWQSSAGRWISGLTSVKDVWTLRNGVRRCIIHTRLSDSEKDYAINNLDSLCSKRVVEIWKTRVLDAERASKNLLRDQVFRGQDSSSDPPPVEYLFQPPVIPNLPQTVKSFIETPFQKYQTSLKRQLLSRSMQLDNVISTLEQCARNIQSDFLHLKSNGDGNTRVIVSELTRDYQPTAKSLSENVASFVKEVVLEAISDTSLHTQGLSFLSRVTANLAYSSSFIHNIGCGPDSVEGFRHDMILVNEMILEKWCQIIVDRVLQEYKSRRVKISPKTHGGPSPQVLEALLMVCQNLQELGLFHYPTKQISVAKGVFRSLVLYWLDENWGNKGDILHDWAFLWKMCDQYGQSFADISKRLADKLNTAVDDALVLSELKEIASEYFARSQTLLAALLPPSDLASESPLLLFGSPSPVQNSQPPIDIAKPSPRFGMLPVSNPML